MSNSDVVVRVEGLGKKYLVPQKHTDDFAEVPGWRERLKEFFPGLLGADERDYFWAMRDISFEVRRGEVMGIIGENGSGKSTLLKILSGVIQPSEGRAELTGRVGSLLEVGTGFHSDLTGRENIFFNGALLGLKQEEVRERQDDIIEFSGVGDFIDVPVKRYSSGMQVRLAYAVASLFKSDIMILDEVLAVGDAKFREKSKEDMKSQALAGATVLFVSHNLMQVRELCDRCIILDNGRVEFEGSAADAVARYWRKQMHIPSATEKENTEEEQEKQDFRMERDLLDIPRYGKEHYANGSRKYLKRIEIFDPDRPDAEEFRTGGRMVVRVYLNSMRDLGNKNLCFNITLFNSLVLTSAKFSNLQNADIVLPSDATFVECVVDDLRLGAGVYALGAGLAYFNDQTQHFTNIDVVGHALFVRITDREFFDGLGVNDLEGTVHRTTWRFS